MSPYRKEGKIDRERILELLRAHEGTWVPLNAILRLGIAQYNTRILELRREGHTIKNRIDQRRAEIAPQGRRRQRDRRPARVLQIRAQEGLYMKIKAGANGISVRIEIRISDPRASAFGEAAEFFPWSDGVESVMVELHTKISDLFRDVLSEFSANAGKKP